MKALKRKAELYLAIERYANKSTNKHNNLLSKLSIEEIEREIKLIAENKEELLSLEYLISSSGIWFVKDSYLDVIKERLLQKEIDRVRENN